MRIMFYLHRYPAIGGIERVTTFLANAFASRGEKVIVVSHFGFEGQDKNGLKAGIEYAKMPAIAYYSRRNRCYLQDKISEFNPDVIIFQDSYAPIGRNLFPLRSHVPVVVFEHNAPYCFHSCHKIAKDNILRNLCKKSIGGIIGELKYIRDRLRRRYLYCNSWRYCLLSERFFGEFKAVARINDARKLRAIPNSAPNKSNICTNKHNEIVFVGTINKRKGCDALLDTWSRVGKRHPDWKLTFVGDGPIREELEEAVSKKGIERVCFDGIQSDSMQYFRRAKIFAFPSRQEGWGLVLTEALSAGCVPIVFNSFSSLGDIIEDGTNGVVVPAFDAEQFERKLEELMLNQSALSKMAEAGPKICDKYSENRVLADWYSLFDELETEKSKE